MSVPLPRWFTVETPDRAAARAAFAAAVAAAAGTAGLADLVPVALPDYLDIPSARIDALLPPESDLPPGEFVRVDLALVPLLVGGAVAAWGVNWQASVPGDSGREAALTGLVVSWWTGRPASSRPVDPATLADFPDALASPCRDRAAGGVTVRLLDAAPLHPRCAFAGA